MENLAYLHVSSVYEDLPSSELISLSRLFKQTVAPDWKRLSGRAWKYMLPLALGLSVLSGVSSALALEKNDRGPSVKTLQQQLKAAGFYQASVTQVYDTETEAAVRRFQRAAGLDVNGVAGSVTLEKLENWRTSNQSSQATKISTRNEQIRTTSSENQSVTNKRRSSNILQKGDEGEDVRVLQERLRIAGFYTGNATKVFGPITEEAVKRFQQAYNLAPDGVVGSETQAKLPTLSIGYGDDSPTNQPTTGDKLRLGDRGEAVRILQEQLINAGYLQGEPNGYFGPNTADAVRRFQEDNYLAASGIAGPTTRAKLYSMANDAPTSGDFSVLEIQRRLREQGFYKGALNGVMGDETKKAIRQAQQFYGMSLSNVRSGRF
ncbi:MAG: peptidoglycan-binding protein [Brasilonema octagenarum HA4186-MV1]|jgi:peptidoglycan hydrolase-like protein with peptidoglycan-binding domain|uniref:Cell wall-binding protein n=2 Tax=Brasilonema TaxID=383614 RepID=A0A856MHV1_9CYAN|nr:MULTISPECIES: peptidoglycan-binding protein [Brasilonema]MBW4625202.1 peptidoglycan-binding protein [Brasilonema octagenarum HA4186-MV1]NMF62925.1 cell wall-binding protein [Brasilonema octagenarum UFV-OR1]QDL10945.1 cell wall-binding protein [Brasilonema sennae CENA114]QDL17290.1 cell wall-binding protein [Brasilonema octagenarum UFV-E1]